MIKRGLIAKQGKNVKCQKLSFDPILKYRTEITFSEEKVKKAEEFYSQFCTESAGTFSEKSKITPQKI